MLSLSSIAGWEEAVLASISGASGPDEERDRQIERSGMYGEYPAIVRAYEELLGAEEFALEAIKRAVFLVWLSAVGSPPVTGVPPLSDTLLRSVISRLDRFVRDGHSDEELLWMLAWYNASARDLFGILGASDATLEQIGGIPADSWRDVTVAESSMQKRGQMGRYWVHRSRRESQHLPEE